MTRNRFLREQRLCYRFFSDGFPEGMIREPGRLKYLGEGVERQGVERLRIESEGRLEEGVLLLLFEQKEIAYIKPEAFLLILKGMQEPGAKRIPSSLSYSRQQRREAPFPVACLFSPLAALCGHGPYCFQSLQPFRPVAGAEDIRKTW